MSRVHFLSKDVVTTQNLALAALDYTTSIGRARKIEMIIFDFSQAVSETITISLILAQSGRTSVQKDIVLVAEEDYTFRPQGEFNIQAGDNIQVECTDNGGVGTVGVTFKTSEIQGG